ncbi:hypothetical protein EIN_521930 [Entamoeba invadens IP1]|uniref:Uncharacterized protein n=1 Tax=Entamoeba invadens IP1 TaxID=370355 RepID=A0A0A1U9R1_ENTIV|nr:hypothetical protein EIN_521930 [Entamoeba invadens IP1]ELP91746.1 hypothetical protein EIN_521930 [Entamoeba invadens IP1]|eukprot:XP_004258517.1 hypothetical protein EIN_521930 [Entamoeba invadens IP1]
MGVSTMCTPRCRHQVNNCEVCDSETTCQKCIDGYILIDGQCQTCQYYGECYQCDIYKCTACSANYKYRSELSRCDFCETELGYYFSGNDCYKCNSICKLCTSASICTECIDGYYLKDSKCLPCTLTGCSKCLETECLTCKTGFYLNNEKLCSPCSDYGKCNQCTIDGCTLCANKMYYNTTTKLCESCVEECDVCENSYSCNKCNNASIYYKEDEIKCATCPVNNKYFVKGLNCKN